MMNILLVFVFPERGKIFVLMMQEKPETAVSMSSADGENSPRGTLMNNYEFVLSPFISYLCIKI